MSLFLAVLSSATIGAAGLGSVGLIEALREHPERAKTESTVSAVAKTAANAVTCTVTGLATGAVVGPIAAVVEASFATKDAIVGGVVGGGVALLSMKVPKPLIPEAAVVGAAVGGAIGAMEGGRYLMVRFEDTVRPIVKGAKLFGLASSKTEEEGKPLLCEKTSDITEGWIILDKADVEEFKDVALSGTSFPPIPPPPGASGPIPSSLPIPFDAENMLGRSFVFVPTKDSLGHDDDDFNLEFSAPPMSPPLPFDFHADYFSPQFSIGKCKQCLTNPVQVVCVPCGHRCVCPTCATRCWSQGNGCLECGQAVQIWQLDFSA